MEHKKKVNKETVKVCFVSFVLPVVIFMSATAISGILPGQKYYFLYGDGEQQFSIFSKAFMDRLFSGKSILYSFDIGMGMPTVALYAFYALSPFNIFFYLIPDVEIAAIFVICGKLACSSGAMCFLLRKWIHSEGVTLIAFSTSYSLCSFFSAFYMSFELLDMLYIMPLLTWGIIRFVRTGKWKKLCLVYAYSFTIHFYTGYITGILSFVLLISYAGYFYGCRKELWRTAFFRYVICVIIAALLSAPVTFPAAIELFSMRAKDITVLEQFSTNPVYFLRGFYFGQTQDVYNDIPMMYCGLSMLLCATLFFLSGSYNRKKHIFAIIPILFLILCSFAEPFYFMIHGFDAPDGYAYRYSWMMDICMILMSAYIIKNPEGVNIKSIWIGAGGWGTTFVLLYVLQQWLHLKDKNPITQSELAINICFMLIYAIVLTHIFCKDNKQGRVIYGLILVLELGISIIWRLDDIREDLFLRQNYSVKEEQTHLGLEYIAEQEKNDESAFYRIHYLNSLGDNISMLYGFKGLGWFSSVENTKVRNFLQKCGYAGKNLLVYDYGSTELMQMLLAQKYSIDCVYYLSENMNYFNVEKKQRSLPLGYMVADSVKTVSLDEHSPFEIQNLLASALCGQPHAIFQKHEGGYQMEADGLELLFSEEGMRLKRTEEIGSAQILFEAEREGKVYAYARRWGMSVLDHDSPAFYSEIDMGGMRELSRMAMPHILPLYRDVDDICRIFISMPEDYENYDFEAIYLAYENEEEITKVYEELSERGMEVVSFRDEEIRGHISVGQDKRVLFTSIPYQKQWKVYVDGVETDTIALLDGAFLGVEMSPGEHDVVFKYQNGWVCFGVLLGIAGAFIYMISVILSKKERRKKM